MHDTTSNDAKETKSQNQYNVYSIANKDFMSLQTQKKDKRDEVNILLY